MLTLLSFWSLSYFVCSLQFREATKLKIPHNLVGKLLIKIVKAIKHFYPKFSFQLLFNVLDYTKCPIFVIASAFLFSKKYIIDLTAIISYLSHYFPIWYGFKNENKNFISIIFTGFLLDPLTGISMIFAFLLSARSLGYTSIAITSSMLVGIIKTTVHILFFNNKDYIEAAFFIFFGVLAIYKNRKILKYICEKSVKKDLNFFKKNNDNNIHKNTNNKLVKTPTKNKEQNEKKTKKYKQNKKNIFFRNYKKFYNNNKHFAKEDKRYN